MWFGLVGGKVLNGRLINVDNLQPDEPLSKSEKPHIVSGHVFLANKAIQSSCKTDSCGDVMSSQELLFQKRSMFHAVMTAPPSGSSADSMTPPCVFSVLLLK